MFDKFHLGLSLNALASRNISVMSVTLDTSHFEISPSYDVAPLNMPTWSDARAHVHSHT